MDSDYLLMDFNKRMDSALEHDRIFGNSLKDQFDNLDLKEFYSIDDLVSKTLGGESTDAHISYPNFERDDWESMGSDSKKHFLNNIAVRVHMPGTNLDIVYMCDLFVKYDDQSDRVLTVKAITAIDGSSNHYGEIDTKCLVLVKMSQGRNWMNGGEYRYIPSDGRQNFLRNSNIDKLAKMYVVSTSDLDKVRNTYHDWKEFFESNIHIISINQEKSKPLSSAEALTVYHSDSVAEGTNRKNWSRVEFLKPEYETHSWCTEKEDPSFVQKAVLHVCIDFPNDQYVVQRGNESVNQKKILDDFTKDSILITDINDDIDRCKNPIKLNDARISPAYVQEVKPEAQMEVVEQKYKITLDNKKSQIRTRWESEIKSLMDEYEKELDLTEKGKFLESEMPATAGRVRLQLEKDIQKRINDLKSQIKSKEKEISDLKQDKKTKNGKKSEKTDQTKSDLDELMKRLDDAENEVVDDMEVDKIASEAAGSDWEKRKRDLVDLKEKETRSDKIQDLTDQLNETEYRLNEDRELELDALITEKTVKRLHYFFEIEEGQDGKPGNIVEIMNKRLGSLKKPALFRDYSGEKRLIDRQNRALENLWRGNVLNPFLATALFSPSSSGTVTEYNVENFMQKNLNEVQKTAIRKALGSNGMFLIQGPPGTGKTQVIAELTTQFIKQGKKVLIASENHKAVDNAFSRLPKIPEIRPVRILSSFNDSKKENEFTKEKLVKNLYEGISKSLKLEVDKYENAEHYIGKLEEIISDLEKRAEEIKTEEAFISGLNEQVSDLESERNEAVSKLDEKKSRNASYKEKVQEISDRILSLDSGNLTARDLSKLEIELQKADADELQGELSESVRTIRKIKDPMDEILRMIEHTEYLEMMEERDCSQSSDMTLETSIKEYEDSNGVGRSDFPLVDVFGFSPDYDCIKSVFKRVNAFIDKLVKKDESKIDILSKSIESTDEDELQIRKIEGQLDSIKSNEHFRNLQELKSDTNRKVLNVFKDLNIPSNVSDLNDAIAKLKREQYDLWDVIDHTSENDKKRMQAYKKIRKYLQNPFIYDHDSEYNQELMKYVNVIGMTCTADATVDRDDPYNTRLEKMNIDVVIVDEVSKITFGELIQPILYGKTVILVGDHRQLSPFYTKINNFGEFAPEIVNEAREEKFMKMHQESFFGNLFERTPQSNKTTLTTQYRMHPQIMQIVNKFYSGNTLLFGGNEASKNHYLNVKGTKGRTLISEDNHAIMIDCNGVQVNGAGTSYKNPEETKIVGELLKNLNAACKADRNGNPLKNEYPEGEDTRLSIGVICPYKDQIRLLKNSINRRMPSFNHDPDESFKIKSIDDFQGDERDIIIISLVRTTGGGGFLENYHRINVAVSRARRLLIIVGCKTCLDNLVTDIDGIKKPIYREMAEEIRRSGGLRDGSDVLSRGV